MKCSGFDRWLDEGQPERQRERALGHGANCARCVGALQAALAIESVLRAERAGRPVSPPPAFVDNVMARVDAAARRYSAPVVNRQRVPWWVAIATDPVSTVSVTVGLSVAAWTVSHPQWIQNLAMDVAARWWSWVLGATSAGHLDIDPIVWLSIGIAMSPLILWGGWVAWRRLERAFVLMAERPVV